MPETIPKALHDRRALQRALRPWVWCAKIRVDDALAMYVCDYDAEVDFEGVTYRPFPLIIGRQERNARGTLGQSEIQVYGPTREAMQYVRLGGVVDRECEVFLLNVESLTASVHRTTSIVLGVTVQRPWVVLRLGQYGIFSAQIPAVNFTRGRCGARYGGAGCWYDLTLPNAIAVSNPDFDPTKCTLLRDGGNGCRSHGDNEAANGKARLHPQVIGARPGIPKGPSRI